MKRLYVERDAGDKSKVTLKLAYGKPMARQPIKRRARRSNMAKISTSLHTCNYTKLDNSGTDWKK
jgi:hypothetical protein